MATKEEKAYLAAYKRAQLADSKFQAALQHQWGYSRAGTKRYVHTEDNAATDKARSAYYRASEALRKALHKMRAKGGSIAANPKRRRNASGGPLDTHAAQELELFTENDATLYRQQEQPIQKNLILKMAKGVYSHEKAVKLYGYLMESGAKKYAREHSTSVSDWHQIFSPATRKAAAERFAHSFEVEAKLGNYDNLLPAKYQGWRLGSKLNPVKIKVGRKIVPGLARKKNGRVQVFVTPQVAKRINPESTHRWTMAAIKAANKAAGYHFFNKGAKRFFNSKIFPAVYQGPGGVYFVTSEYMDSPSDTKYSVRQFKPETGNVNTVGGFNFISHKSDAVDQAKKMARG